MYKGICQECGFIRVARISDFKNSKNSKCTHLNVNNTLKGGLTTWTIPRLGIIFRSTKNNCYNKNDGNFEYYGAKNIKIADNWLKNPLLFEQWAIENGYAENLVLSRKDKTKDFSQPKPQGSCRCLRAQRNCGIV